MNTEIDTLAGISSSAVANRRSDGITVTFVVRSSTEALKEAADSKMEVINPVCIHGGGYGACMGCMGCMEVINPVCSSVEESTKDTMPGVAVTVVYVVTIRDSFKTVIIKVFRKIAI